jgi:hypothetical protein
MPFDGSNLAPSAQDLLDAALFAEGLRRVDAAFLDAHKVKQIDDHPPGWIYRHRDALQLGMAGALIASMVSFGLLCAANHYATAITVSLVIFALAVMPMLVPLPGGPAQWRERAIDGDLAPVHPAIRESAQRLKQRLPEVSFRIGELFQARTTLDPYLIADYRGAEAILGIWDGDQLIACA